MISDDENKPNLNLIFLGKQPEKEFEGNFDAFYDKYREIATKKGYSGELKFINSFGLVWVYVIITP